MIWLKQTIPAQLLIVSPEFEEGIETEEEYEENFAPVLKEAAEFYRQNIPTDKN